MKEPLEGDAERVTITPGSVVDNIPEGAKILFDDGYISTHVVQNTSQGVVVEIENGGVIKSGKGVNIPDVHLNLPAMTEHDIEDLRFGCTQDVDIVAASFIRSSDHILAIRQFWPKRRSRIS